MSDASTPSVRSPVFKYSLQTLLFVVLCVAAFLAAYRTGFDRGYADGGKAWRGEQIVPRAYFVGDLAGPNGVYSTQELLNIITARIDASTWEGVGGPGGIDVLEDRDRNPVFVITNHQGVHDEIESILEGLRRAID